MTIKPIETRYGGHRFRSRLEARWAVFFDELGVTWDYEPQGFDLGDAGLYLPDFWLEDHQCWFEVKGQWPEYHSPEIRKLRALGYETESAVILAAERIGDKTHTLFAHDLGVNSAGEFQGAGIWSHLREDGLLVFQVDVSRSRILYANSTFEKEIPWVENVDGPTADKKVWAAYMTARGARFEHGENGRRRR